jgi:release factor glutamine methyltransferase
MRPEAMFFGDRVLLKFLQDLLNRLSSTGRALIGLNSPVGIQDILKRYSSTHPTDSPLKFRLLERHSLPLLFYTPGWKLAEPLLIKEFKVWRDHHNAAYTVDANGQLNWSYEVIECTHMS